MTPQTTSGSYAPADGALAPVAGAPVIKVSPAVLEAVSAFLWSEPRLDGCGPSDAWILAGQLLECAVAASLREKNSCFGCNFPSGGLGMAKPQHDENFDEMEAQERFEAALRGALKTPHEPLKEKPKVKKTAKKRTRDAGSGR